MVTANKALLAENGAEIYGAAREYGADLRTRPRWPGPSQYCARCASRSPQTPVPCARHRQWHHQLHPGPDGLLRRRLRRVPGGSAGARHAEADPTADVEGFDAAAKAAILASLAFHTPVTAADVHREGITEVTATDILSARALGRVVSCWPSATAATAASRSGCTRR